MYNISFILTNFMRRLSAKTWLEGQSDCKVEREVALEVGMDNGIVVARIGVGRVDGLHTCIKAHDKEVGTKAHTVSHGYLSPEGVEVELSARLVCIVADGPDVAGIEEDGSIEFPEHVGAVLHVHVEFHISRLVDEVDASVCALERARTKTAHRPSPSICPASSRASS